MYSPSPALALSQVPRKTIEIEAFARFGLGSDVRYARLMKLGLIAAVLFLASYAAVNGGFGPQPLRLLIPVLVAVASALGAGLVMRRRPGRKPPGIVSLDMPAPPQPLSRAARLQMPPIPPADRPGGGRARKLF